MCVCIYIYRERERESQGPLVLRLEDPDRAPVVRRDDLINKLYYMYMCI